MSIDARVSEIKSNITYTVVIIAIIVYYVYEHHKKIKKLQKEHEAGVHCSEGFNPYAARLQQYADSGLTNTSVISWGDVGGPTCPTKSQARSYLAKDNFLGNHGPPVFYDIGDVQQERALRSAHGYNISKQGVVSGRKGKRKETWQSTSGNRVGLGSIEKMTISDDQLMYPGRHY